MEGDLAPIPELAEIAAEHEATLIVDDSHGIGVVGETGRGVLERFGLLGATNRPHRHPGQGARRGLGRLRRRRRGALQVLEQRSRVQLFSNGLPPDGGRQRPAGARRAARRARARRAAAREHRGHARGRSPRGCGRSRASAILPIIVGETATAIEISGRLLERGVYVTGFGYLVVPEGTARIRIQVSAALTLDQIETAVEALADVAAEAGLGSPA